VKVGLNATCLNNRPSGARQRFEGIYGALIRQLPEVEFVVYEPSDCRVADWFSGASNVSARSTPLPSEGRLKRVLRGTGYWPLQLEREQFDVLECFSQPLVRANTGLTLTTIHDIRRVYSNWNPVERAAYSISLRQTFSKADHVITVSESMRKEILAFDARAKVTVVYNGLDAASFRLIDEAQKNAVIAKFGLPDQFILAVGHFERRKNYGALIEAMARLKSRRADGFLVIVGNDSGERRMIEGHVARLELESRVKILSGLSDMEVRSLYKLCAAFVFPSVYEGFGIPILEAMAAGVPYVLSDIPVFREITESQGVYFNPKDPDAMADAIMTTLESTATQNKLVEFGTRRVQEFTFDRLAARIATLYRR
jgi:glycosyltransferase involved in cell wall biosynthesis